MKNILIIFILLLFSIPSFAGDYKIDKDGNIIIGNEKSYPMMSWQRLTGTTGIDLLKQENGNWLETLYIQGEYQVDPRLLVDFRFAENFSVMRGSKFPSIGNHHSWNYRLGLHYSPFSNGLTVYTAWDNSKMIIGHDDCFLEYDGNSNLFGIYYKF